ncbi:MAG: hypothetical protein WCG27_04130 [Pseudomonadota bacterium]
MIFAIIVFYLIAAWFNAGHHHPDEYYQIIDYLLFFNGDKAADSLTYEFSLKMRPFFQPLLYWGIAKVYWAVGAKSPFVLAYLFRLLTVGVFLGGCVYWMKYLKENGVSKLNLCLLPLLWFVPYFAVRASADSLSAAFIYLGMGYLYARRFHFRTYLIFSVLCGLAYLIRYQNLFFFAVAVCWLGWQKKLNLWQLLVGVGICAFVGLGEFPANYLGYGEWVFSSYNHFYQNILAGKAAGFGTMPLWGYLTLTFIKGIPPLSLVVITAFIYFWYTNPRSLLALSTLLYFIFFSLFPHKEIRFLTPLIFLSPIILIDFFQGLGKKWRPWIYKGFIVGNFILLPFASLIAAYRPILIYQQLYQMNDSSRDVVVFWDNFRPEIGKHLRLEMDFYKKFPWQETPVDNLSKLDEELGQGAKLLLVTSTLREYHLVKDYSRCFLHSSIYPNFALSYNWFNWANHSAVWALWRCR